jgi:hypothetical protein
MTTEYDPQDYARAQTASLQGVERQLESFNQTPALKSFMTHFALMKGGKVAGKDFNPYFEKIEQGPMAQANAIAKAYRRNTVAYQRNPYGDGDKLHELDARREMGEVAYAKSLTMQKAVLDVGYLTDLAALTGGQTLGMVSMDYRLARGTVRPDSFTLYNILKKTRANQMVDFWPYASSVGGQMPGSAYVATANQTSGTLATNNGIYSEKFVTLKMLVDGRALSVALAAQNSFVDIAEQESANAAINILSTQDWAIYWGNPTIYSNQVQGIYNLIPTANVYDFFQLYNASTGTLATQQFMYNLIYEVAGKIAARNYGRTTHAFGQPEFIADMQQLVTTKFDNWLNFSGVPQGIVVNGDLQGTRTRFGDIQFPQDLFISFRDRPAQSYVQETNASVNGAVYTSVTVSTVAGAVGTGTSGSEFTTAYAGNYIYAVCAADASMNESVLTYSAIVSGVAAGGSVALTITPSGAGAAGFRVYRSALGYAATGASIVPSAFRYIGDIAANGASAVVFTDLNTKIPGSCTVFLLDLDDNHDALDYRWLLPITKIDLFAQNLYMPWAVAHIGAPRLRVPKYHAVIKNYVAQDPNWSPTTVLTYTPAYLP